MNKELFRSIALLLSAIILTAAFTASLCAWMVWGPSGWPFAVLALLCLGGLVGVCFCLMRDLVYSSKVFFFWNHESDYASPGSRSRKQTADDMIRTISEFADYINQEKARHSSSLMTKKAELAALQSQINPHFLYNTLDAIRGLALKRGVPEISEMTGAMSAMFRYSISSSGEFQSFEEDIENLDNYILIQKFRFADRFEVVKEFKDQDSIMQVQIPKLMIQPLVENAIYHGIETIGRKSIIKLTAYITNRCFVIEVSDNGAGMDPESLERLNMRINGKKFPEQAQKKSGGIALVNVNQRIKLYYGDTYGLTIYSTKGLGTTAKLTLPYRGVSGADREAT